MKIQTETVVFLENKPGTLARLARALAAKGINIEGFMVHEGVDHGVIRMVTSDPRKTSHVLGEAGMLALEAKVLRVPLPNKPGALSKLASRLAKAKMNIEYAYGTVGTTGKDAALVVRVDDPRKARALLGRG